MDGGCGGQVVLRIPYGDLQLRLCRKEIEDHRVYDNERQNIKEDDSQKIIGFCLSFSAGPILLHETPPDGLFVRASPYPDL